MIQEIAPLKFDNQYRAAVPRKSDTVLMFKGTGRRDDMICVAAEGPEESGILRFPTVAEAGDEELTYLFSIDDMQYFLKGFKYAAALSMTCGRTEVSSGPDSNTADAPAYGEDSMVPPEGYSFEPIRVLRRSGPVHLSFAGMTGYHLFTWYRNAQFCGRCGHITTHDDKLRMKRCSKCGNMIFPIIAPAVIIGLRNGDSLMMSRYAGREYKGRALLAGFCEIGETPEETVAREVMEEVGLKAVNVTYFGSQPWGFDSNLLLGYFADLEGDASVKLDTEELASAGFVKREDIEYEPNLYSLTATMIEAFRTGKA